MGRGKQIAEREAELIATVSARADWNVGREGFFRKRSVAWIALHPPLRAEIRVDSAPPPFVAWMYIWQGRSHPAGPLTSAYGSETRAASVGHVAERFSAAEDAVRAAEGWWAESCAVRQCPEHANRGPDLPR